MKKILEISENAKVSKAPAINISYHRNIRPKQTWPKNIRVKSQLQACRTNTNRWSCRFNVELNDLIYETKKPDPSAIPDYLKEEFAWLKLDAEGVRQLAVGIKAIAAEKRRKDAEKTNGNTRPKSDPS